jgi:hypothetical protein
MIKWAKDKIYCWRSGQSRTPGATRGRIYSRDGASSGGIIGAKVQPKLKMTMKVTRVDGSVEYHEAKNVVLTGNPYA